MFDIKITKEKDLWGSLSKQFTNTDSGLSIGFFPEYSYGAENDNLPVATVAQWNEEGTSTNPVRPFMRVGFALPLEKGKYDKLFLQSISRILEGKSNFSQEYKILGPVFVKDMKKSIVDWSTPPNSPRTVEEKGFNDPLIDSGKMLESVDYKIERVQE